MRRVLTVLACGMLLMSSCSIENILFDTSEDLQRKFQSLKEWEHLPLRNISWNQAVAMMAERNHDMIRADSTIESAKREVRSVFTDLIPGVSYYGNFSNTIAGLLEASNAGSSSYNIQVSFSLPSLTQVPYRVYSAQARAFSAEKAREGKMRELSSRLYKQIRNRELALKLKEMEEHKHNAPPKTTEQLQKEADAEAQFWQDMSELLGDNSARWMVIHETMPRINWESYRKKLDTLDELVLCEMAMRVEQARLQQYGVALRYLPTINTSLYSPSLFTSTGGTYDGAFLDSEDTTLNMSISYALDTELSNWNNYKTNKENFDLTCKEIVSELITRRATLRTLKNSFSEYEVWKGFMKKKMKYLRSHPPDSAKEFIDRSSLLIDMQRELLQQEKNSIETEASLLLEYGFPGEKKNFVGSKLED